MAERQRSIPPRELFTQNDSGLTFQESFDDQHRTEWRIHAPVPSKAHQLYIADRLGKEEMDPVINRHSVYRDLESDFSFPFQTAYVVSRKEGEKTETIGLAIVGVNASIEATTAYKKDEVLFQTIASYSSASGRLQGIRIELASSLRSKENVATSIYSKRTLEENTNDLLKRIDTVGFNILSVGAILGDKNFSASQIARGLTRVKPFIIRNLGYDFSASELERFEDVFSKWFAKSVYENMPVDVAVEKIVLVNKSMFVHGLAMLDATKAQQIKEGKNLDDLAAAFGEKALAGILFKHDTNQSERANHQVNLVLLQSGVGNFYTIQDEMHPAWTDPIDMENDNTIMTAGGYIYTINKKGDNYVVVSYLPTITLDPLLDMNIYGTKKITSVYKARIDQERVRGQLTAPEYTGWEEALDSLPTQEIR